MVQSIFIEDSSCQVARKGVFCEIMPQISGFQVAHTIVRLLTFGKQYFLQCTTILPKSCGSINFYRGFILSGSKKRGFLSKSAPDFWFPGGAYYCQTSHFWKILFSSMYHNIAKIAWFNQFLLRIHLVRQQEKGFSVKQCPGFLVSRWRILLSDFSLLENTIFFNVPQYCQNRVVQSIFIEDSSCQVARKGVFCERVPRISGFQVAHTIVRLLIFGKQYFLQCTTILPKSHVVQSIFIEDSSCQVARKGVFCEIVPRISGFQVAAYYCQTSHFWKIVFSSMYHNIAKIAWFNQFLSRIHLVRQQEKGFSVK